LKPYGDFLILEHAIYTLALCVFAGVLYEKYTFRNPVWIIWFACLIPDIDYIIEYLQRDLFRVNATVYHGDFHTIFVMLVVSVGLGWIISKYMREIHIYDAILCVSVGFFAHLVEDAFVYNPSYAYFAPFCTQSWCFGIISATNDMLIYGEPIGSTKVFVAGIVLLSAAIGIRLLIQDASWLGKYLRLIPYTVHIPRISSILVVYWEDRIKKI
jgi:hypothetical protein